MRVPHNRITFDQREIDAASSVVRSGMWAAGAQQVAMEERLCHTFGTTHATGLGSGLAGLRLALLACGIKGGDEVLIPAFSCVALANAVLSVDARPIAVDVLEGSWNMDPAIALKQVSPRTKAAIVVNTFGIPADQNSFQNASLPVIEDCSHGFACEGARPAALHSDMAVFSFYATKLIAGGEGGAILTNIEQKAAFIRQWRDYTDKPRSRERMNDKMTDIEAALVSCQLRRLDDMVEKRRERAIRYNEAFSDLPHLALPHDDDGRVWYRYVIKLPPDTLDGAIAALDRLGIAACRPVECWLDAKERAECPKAASAYKDLLSLPLYPTLSDAEQDHVISAVRSTAQEWKTGH